MFAVIGRWAPAELSVFAPWRHPLRRGSIAAMEAAWRPITWTFPVYSYGHRSHHRSSNYGEDGKQHGAE